MSDWEDVLGEGRSAESVIAGIQGPRWKYSREAISCDTWNEARAMALKDQSATIHPDADRPGCYLVEVDWAIMTGIPHIPALPRSIASSGAMKWRSCAAASRSNLAPLSRAGWCRLNRLP